MVIEAKFLQFLNNHPFKRILLGFSGGSDSTCLFYLLLKYKVPFAAAHIDHGWREESQIESEELKELCVSFKVPFYSKRLKKEHFNKNLEEKGRIARYAFFKELCEKQGYEGVLVGHHADDQAETVLKRIFEGAALRRLKGLDIYTSREGLKIWRPLLDVRKKDILEWLKKEKVAFFEDRTNQNQEFLRPRMRQTLLPYLSKCFGKEVDTSLCRLGKFATELDEFLKEVLVDYRHLESKENEDEAIDLSSLQLKTNFEWRLIIHDFFERKRISIPSTVMDRIIEHLKRRDSNKRMIAAKREIIVHRGKLTIKGIKKGIEPNC